MSNPQRSQQEAQPAYVLHSYPYRETSLVIEVFSYNFGRLAVVARGARRPKSAVRGLLQAFQPLQLSWFGKTELKTLHSAEWQGGQPQLKGMALLCGFYLNELLMKLLHRDDPHENLFLYYQKTLLALAVQQDYAAILRHFEIRLLQELGYALTLDHDVKSGLPIEPERQYVYQVEHGPEANDGVIRMQKGVQLNGKTLLDMGADDYSHPVTLQQSKTLMRTLINHYLGEQVLHTRQLLKDLQQI